MAIKKPKAPKGKNPQGKHKFIDSRLKKRDKKVKRSKNANFIPLGDNPLIAEKKEKEKEEKEKGSESLTLVSAAPAAQQLRFFLHRFQSANGFKLSPLELEAFKDTCMVELSQSMDQDVENFGEHMKAPFEGSWKDVLCEGKLLEGKVDAGCPAIIVISTSALRSLELLRGLKSLTRECRPAKLFAKHMKVEEQVALLKGRVNIACGTPSRYKDMKHTEIAAEMEQNIEIRQKFCHLDSNSIWIKKLIDMDALLLSRLQVIVLDMQRNAKGFSLFTLPQVSTEFWDLYKSHFNERLLQGHTKICFYGHVSCAEMSKICRSDE